MKTQTIKTSKNAKQRRVLRLLIVLISTLLYSHSVNAESYTLNVGETLKINCTATAPAGGYIHHAYFKCQNPEDEEYLGFAYNSSDCQATAYGFRAKANIPVVVTYAYSYTGIYDNNIHVGSAEYTIYVTVKGGVQPTKIAFSPMELEMKVGETRTVDIVLYPSNAATRIECGELMWGGTF